MGFWTKIRKPLIGAGMGAGMGLLFGGPLGAIAGASVGGVAGTQRGLKDIDKKQAQQTQQAQQAQQVQITQLAQEKAIASESARLQEEEARKRTLFAGTTLGETSERKKLLGL